jgi:hypothetical protein
MDMNPIINKIKEQACQATFQFGQFYIALVQRFQFPGGNVFAFKKNSALEIPRLDCTNHVYRPSVHIIRRGIHKMTIGVKQLTFENSNTLLDIYIYKQTCCIYTGVVLVRFPCLHRSKCLQLIIITGGSWRRIGVEYPIGWQEDNVLIYKASRVWLV